VKKLGSNLGPITAENRVIGPKTTQNQRKRDNNSAFLPLLRDQAVGGSNPLSSTTIHLPPFAKDAKEWGTRATDIIF
jgi:hypothetical protein